jgi:hypothetical protein
VSDILVPISLSDATVLDRLDRIAATLYEVTGLVR